MDLEVKSLEDGMATLYSRERGWSWVCLRTGGAFHCIALDAEAPDMKLDIKA